MKYLCLVYLSKENWNACPDDHCFDFAEGLHKSGRLLAAEPLHPVETATTVRVRNGQVTMTDGPFAETKEQLADRKSTRLNSSHPRLSRMPSSA